MKQDLMLMLVFAFLVGLFFKQITGPVCGVVEGYESTCYGKTCPPEAPVCQIRGCFKESFACPPFCGW